MPGGARLEFTRAGHGGDGLSCRRVCVPRRRRRQAPAAAGRRRAPASRSVQTSPLAELNGDEEPDVLRVGPSDLRILSGAEEFTFSAPTALSWDSTYTEIQVADLHEDIANDIIALGVTGADIFLSPRSFRTLSFNPPGQGRFAGTRGRARSGESEAPVGRGPNPMDMFHEPSGRSRARHGPVAGGTLAPNKFAFGAARP